VLEEVQLSRAWNEQAYILHSAHAQCTTVPQPVCDRLPQQLPATQIYINQNNCNHNPAIDRHALFVMHPAGMTRVDVLQLPQLYGMTASMSRVCE
jgi:hypothetical protein